MRGSVFLVSKLIVNRDVITIRRSLIHPSYLSKSVLVADPWEYVEMWLQRNQQNKGSREALFYWRQSKQFYQASSSLDMTSAPLTLYYSFLNAAKTLLLARGVSFSDHHGVSGSREKGNLYLSKEKVKLHGQNGGILPSLCSYLEDDIVNKEESYRIFSLKQLLHNLVYIHRSYCLTYSSDKEIFIPLDTACFIKKSNSRELWFSCEIDSKFSTRHILKKIEDIFEEDRSLKKIEGVLEENRSSVGDKSTEKYNVRFKKKRARWTGKFSGKAFVESENFLRYHRRVRKHLNCISGYKSRWYIKMDSKDSINMNPLCIAFASMHRLSELSRYNPVSLSKYSDSRCNWLISEFVKKAPYQFITEIASEITGEEFIIPRDSF